MKNARLLKNCSRRFIAIVTALVIVVSVFSGSFVFSLTNEQEERIAELKAAWKELEVADTELFAVPENAVSTAELSKEEKEAYGEYYKSGEKTNNYTYPSGKNSFKDYTGINNVKFSFGYKVTGTNGANIKLNINGSEHIIPIAARETVVKFEDTAENIFSSSNYAVTDISVSHAIRGVELDVGCIFVSYEGNASLPSNNKDFTVREWIAEAKAFDLSICKNSTDRFVAAIKALEETINEDGVIKELIAEWNNLRITKTELFAVPAENARHSTAESNFSDRDKAALGDYYYVNTNGNTYYYTYPDGKTSFKNYTGKENVKYKFAYKLVLGEGSEKNFHITFQNMEGTYGSVWMGVPNLVTQTSVSAKNLGGSGKDFYNMKQVQVKNPNKHELTLGCLYATYDVPVELPVNYESFTAKDWITAAESLDLSDCANTDSFYQTLTYLREFTSEGRAFNKLVSEWEKLILNRTEVFAIPGGGESTANLSDEEKDAYGSYYKLIPSGGELQFTYPDGQTSLKDLSVYDNVKYFFSYKTVTEGNTGKFELQVNGGAHKFYPTNNSVNNIQKYSATATDFAGDKKVTGVKIGAWHGSGLYIGNLFASYDAPAEMPEDITSLSLRELVRAAEKIDLTQFEENIQEHFKGEVAAAKDAIEPIVIDPKALSAAKSELIAAWKQLTYQQKELWAIPPAAYRQTTTEEIAKSFDLKAEELGPYYAKVNLKEIMLFYNSLDGVSSNFETLTDSVAIEMYFSFLDENGNPKSNVAGGKMDMQLNVKDTAWPNSWSHKVTVSKTQEKFTKYFDGTTEPNNFKIFNSGDNKYPNVAVGCVYKIAVKNEVLPYGYANMELPALLEYANALDLSKYDDDADANRFSNAIKNATTYANLMVLGRSETLCETAAGLGITLDAGLPANEIIAAAIAQDLSTVSNKDKYLADLWQLRLCTKDGAAIENLKHVWGKTGVALPNNYAQLSVEQWVNAAAGVAIADANTKAQFDKELRQLKYYLTGVPDVSELKKYVDLALTMKAGDFVSKTYSSFYNVLYSAQQIVNNPAAYSQSYTDEMVDSLLAAWGQLKYYSKTMYLDTNEYFQGDITKQATISPKDPRNTYVEFIKGLDLGPGFDCGAKVVNWKPADGVFNFGGKDLMPLNGYSTLEFYVKVEDATFVNGMINFSIQLMNKDGSEWFDYYITINDTQAKQGWIRVLIPIKNFYNYANGKRQEGIYMNENGFIVRMARVFINKGSATFSMSNIVALKENNAVAGVVPTISDVSVYRPPEKVKNPPKNPFDGLDRGDPWGDEYRLTLNKGQVSDNNEKNDISVNKDSSVSPLVYVIVAIGAVVLAAAVILIIFLISKKKKQKNGEE